MKRIILNIKDAIENTVRLYCDEKFDVFWYGAYDIDPKHLVYWICVQTDQMKMDLTNNIKLNNDLRFFLEKYKYPASARKSVYIGFESQETVNRESKGNWYHHFK